VPECVNRVNQNTANASHCALWSFSPFEYTEKHFDPSTSVFNLNVSMIKKKKKTWKNGKKISLSTDPILKIDVT
jgi:hypothetical protein